MGRGDNRRQRSPVSRYSISDQSFIPCPSADSNTNTTLQQGLQTQVCEYLTITAFSWLKVPASTFSHSFWDANAKVIRDGHMGSLVSIDS